MDYNNESDENIRSQNWQSEMEWYEPRDNTIVNYMVNTSVHGIKYVGEPKLHIFERILWLSAFVGSVTLGGVLISQMWDRYQRLPVITVLNPSRLPISNIPFPAVTICNANQVKKSKMLEYLDRIRESIKTGQENSSYDDYVAYHDVKRMCSMTNSFVDHFVSGDKKRDQRGRILKMGDVLETVHATSRTLNLRSTHGNILRTLLKVSQPCEDMILLCLWQNEVHNCTDMFYRIATDFGVCCTFNMKPEILLYKWVPPSHVVNLSQEYVDEWKDEELQKGNLLTDDDYISQKKFPRRQIRAGKTAGLSILLDADLDDYYCSFMDSKGFAVALHTPITVPDMSERGIAIAANAEVFVGVTPEVTLADESIKDFSPDKRHCVDGETKLAKYTTYTQTNCVKECLANITLANCSCLPYHLPRSPGDKYCTLEELMCAASIKKNVTSLCEMCLPTCTDIWYKHQITTLQVQHEAAELLLDAYPQFNISSGHTRHNRKHLSIIHVYFMDDMTDPKLRKEQFGIIDLLSNGGGLLGLCLGFSGLSLLELIYFFTVRVLCRRYRKKCELTTTTDCENPRSTNVAVKTSRGMPNSFDEYNQNVFKIMRNKSFESRTQKGTGDLKFEYLF